MFCVRCQNDLAVCVCPDKEQRVRELSTVIEMHKCGLCKEPIYICKCLIPKEKVN